MSPPEDLALRTADAEDIGAIAELFLVCWRTSYRGVLPPQLVSMFDQDSARDLWRRSFVDEPRARVVLLAERPDRSVAGVISMGRDPDLPGAGHIFSLYVHPDAQGLGIGRMLVEAAVEHFGADGLAHATLWVFEANIGGRKFYQRLGWLPDGATRVEPEYGEPELRLGRSISATA